MKRLILLLPTLLLTYWANAQVINYQRGDSIIVTNSTKTATLKIENATRNIAHGFLYNIGGGKVIFRQPQISDILHLSDSLSTSTYTFDMAVNIGAGKYIGQYANGTTAHFVNKTIPQIFQDIATAVIPPTYVAPTLTLNGTRAQGGYRVGTVFSGSDLGFSVVYTQNNGGSTTGSPIYFKNGTITTPPYNLTLTSTITVQATQTFGQGNCIVDNTGNINCTGRINAGTATSNTLSYSPLWDRYWGVCVGTTPTNSEILAAVGGGADFITNHSFSISNIAVTGSKHVFVCHLSSYGHITSLVQNGFPSFAAYTEVSVSVTNVNSHVDSYYALVSNNVLTTDSGTITAN